MRRARHVLAGLALAAVALCASAPAGAAPVPTAAIRIAFTLPSGPHSVWAQAPGNCLLFAYGWSPDSSTHYAGATDHARGLLDVTARSGEAIVPGEALHVDRIFGPRPRAVAAADVGLQLAGRRAYLTRTIRSSRSYSARSARRVRLAQLHGVTLASRDARGGLVVSVKGRATMLAPLAGMLNRLRCRGPRVDEHPIPVGAPLGTVTATIVPARASAAAASFSFRLSLAGTAYGPEPPRLEPTGGAQLRADRLAFAAVPGARVTASCTASGCEPYAGSVTLQGGFDFVDGARRLSVTGLSASLSNGRLTIRGTAGGTQVTVASESDTGQMELDGALRAQLAATFGDPELDGFVVGVRLPLGPLAPA